MLSPIRRCIFFCTTCAIVADLFFIPAVASAFLLESNLRQNIMFSSQAISTSLFAEAEGPIVYRDQVELPSGVSMQVLSSFPPQPSTYKPLLLFLHGSFHGAWCWSENYFDYFVGAGYSVVAPNWRGTGGTHAGDGVTKVRIDQHVADLHCLLESLPEILRDHGVPVGHAKPVVVSHSFGGLALMKYLEAFSGDSFQGVATVCSVPPSGNGKMTMRFLRNSLIASYKITRGFAMKACLTSADLCRELFFGGKREVLDDGSVNDYGISDEDVQRYQKYFARDTVATIDLFDLAKNLPSDSTTADGKANFLNQAFPPCIVLGASNDFLVDRPALDETARYFGLDKAHIVDSPHDIMLGTNWENAARVLEEWIEESVL